MDILDLVPSTKDVPVDGGAVTVRGLPNRVVFGLFDRFRELLILVLGGGVDIPRAITRSPDVCLAIMAAGAGVAGDEKREAALDALPTWSQAAIIEAILDRTCGAEGVGPFVSRMAGLLTPRDSTAGNGAAAEDTGGELTPLVPPAGLSQRLN
jgi:hypothetical protein